MYKCLKCHAFMVKRKRKRDGHPFLGCSNYPVCTYTMKDCDGENEGWAEIGEDNPSFSYLEDLDVHNDY
jgi:ssDNA-binding Zn-finger/Zn-ribbon topoisomerase 1